MFEPEALNQTDQNTESDCNAAWKGHISPLIPDPRSGDISGPYTTSSLQSLQCAGNTRSAIVGQHAHNEAYALATSLAHHIRVQNGKFRPPRPVR